eukprot:COSAG06_NODE_1486_length_9299_cov_3.915435_7_plen_258_part_00
MHALGANAAADAVANAPADAAREDLLLISYSKKRRRHRGQWAELVGAEDEREDGRTRAGRRRGAVLAASLSEIASGRISQLATPSTSTTSAIDCRWRCTTSEIAGWQAQAMVGVPADQRQRLQAEAAADYHDQLRGYSGGAHLAPRQRFSEAELVEVDLQFTELYESGAYPSTPGAQTRLASVDSNTSGSYSASTRSSTTSTGQSMVVAAAWLPRRSGRRNYKMRRPTTWRVSTRGHHSGIITRHCRQSALARRRRC